MSNNSPDTDKYEYHCNNDTLLEERVPRSTRKGNSDGFIFGTLKGILKNPITGCCVKYPLMGFP